MKPRIKIQPLPSTKDIEDITKNIAMPAKDRDVLKRIMDFWKERTSNGNQVLIALTNKQARELKKIIDKIKTEIK